MIVNFKALKQKYLETKRSLDEATASSSAETGNGYHTALITSSRRTGVTPVSLCYRADIPQTKPPAGWGESLCWRQGVAGAATDTQEWYGPSKCHGLLPSLAQARLSGAPLRPRLSSNTSPAAPHRPRLSLRLILTIYSICYSLSYWLALVEFDEYGTPLIIHVANSAMPVCIIVYLCCYNTPTYLHTSLLPRGCATRFDSDLSVQVSFKLIKKSKW